MIVHFLVPSYCAEPKCVWKALWGSLWLEMKIAFGNSTKRINFDFISGSFSKLIINLPAGPGPSACMTCLVSEGGNGPCEARRIRELQKHGGWNKPPEIIYIIYVSNINLIFKTFFWSMLLPTTKALLLCKFLFRTAFLFKKVLKHVLSFYLNLQDSA